MNLLVSSKGKKFKIPFKEIVCHCLFTNDSTSSIKITTTSDVHLPYQLLVSRFVFETSN